MRKDVPEEKLAQLVLLVAGEMGDDEAHLVIHHHHPQPEHLHKKQTNRTDLLCFLCLGTSRLKEQYR
jgi:hypothetical protein